MIDGTIVEIAQALRARRVSSVELATEALRRIDAAQPRFNAFITIDRDGAMEAAVVNLCSPGDEVIVVRCGKFGERWAEIARAFGLRVQALDAPYGHTVPPEGAEHGRPDVSLIDAILPSNGRPSVSVPAPLPKNY